jgi:hypothetical protein
MSFHVPTQADMFGVDDPLIGLKVQLEREIDQHRRCHDNIAEISSGRGPHCYALVCAACGRFRGWLPKRAVDFIRETVRVHGVPRGPLIYRDATQTKSADGAGGRSNANAPDGDDEVESAAATSTPPPGDM